MASSTMRSKSKMATKMATTMTTFFTISAMSPTRPPMPNICTYCHRQRHVKACPPSRHRRKVARHWTAGFAREFIPELELTDVVQAPWHGRRMSAEALLLEDGSVGALVLFDVLHHVAAPAAFFAEAARVLRPGGRIVLCEPYISPVSRWVYRRFHPEPVDMSVDPLVAAVQVMDAA